MAYYDARYVYLTPFGVVVVVHVKVVVKAGLVSGSAKLKKSVCCCTFFILQGQ